MRIRTTAATAALLLTALTACGSGDGDPDEKSATKAPAAKSKESNDGDGGGVDKLLRLGEPAQTIGDEGTGVLQITPDTIVYVKKDGTEPAENGVFAVITVKDKAMTGAPADEVAPISNGGWSWIAADGEAVKFDGGNSSSIVIDKYNNADPVQPGTFQRRLKAFDLTAEQADGGTLLYTDGEGTAYRWKMPAGDSGPHVAEVKSQLER